MHDLTKGPIVGHLFRFAGFIALLFHQHFKPFFIKRKFAFITNCASEVERKAISIVKSKRY